MSFSKVASAFFLLLFALLLQGVVGANPISLTCSSPSSNVNQQFKTNLNSVFRYLASNAPKFGFAYNSVNTNQEEVDGVALCRGDGGIIWYDNCLFRYSDRYFSGQVDYNDMYVFCNPQSATYVGSFNAARDQLLNGLWYYIQNTPKLYVADIYLWLGSTPIYGFTQCTKDLSITDSRNCVANIIKIVQYNCNGNLGGQVGTSSCIIRYEMYPFLHR